MKPALSLIILTLFSFDASLIHADDWPGWRGPKGDGISMENSAPLSWSATENVTWRTPLPGVGHSSPIVIKDRVFVTVGDPADESRRVICLEKSTGHVLWNISVLTGPGGQMHRFNSTASSTPVSDGERVFATFVDDQGLYVTAVDFDGTTIWSKNPGTFYSNHGFAACPVLYGEGVIINGQQDGDAFVCMLRRQDGEELWRYKPAINLRSFSTPLLTKVDGDDQLILTGSGKTVGLNPKTGETIWHADGPSEKFVCTPAVGHGLVFSFGGSPEKNAMALKLGGRGDILNSALAWRNERSMPYVPSPILVGDYLHVINDSGVYTCVEPRSGKVLKTGRKLGSVYSSPVAVANRIYFFEDSGACTIIRNNPDFEVLARNELEETVQTTPAISDGKLYVRTNSHLVQISSPGQQ